ncbi:MAG: hypothetical protein ACXVRX_10730 [Solirubrobacteraceae bacterium]
MSSGPRTPAGAPGRRAAFLDRDGVINRKRPEGSYVTSWDDFELLPERWRASRCWHTPVCG